MRVLKLALLAALLGWVLIGGELMAFGVILGRWLLLGPLVFVVIWIGIWIYELYIEQKE